MQTFGIFLYQTSCDSRKMKMQSDTFLAGLPALRYLDFQDVVIENQPFLSPESVSGMDFARFPAEWSDLHRNVRTNRCVFLFWWDTIEAHLPLLRKQATSQGLYGIHGSLHILRINNDLCIWREVADQMPADLPLLPVLWRHSRVSLCAYSLS